MQAEEWGAEQGLSAEEVAEVLDEEEAEQNKALKQVRS